MPNIRVTCPACKSELEIDAAFEGQEVECGNCLEVFKAARPGSAGSPGTGSPDGAGSSGRGKIPGAGAGSPGGSGRGRSSDRPPPRRRRRDDDYDERRRRDDDYDDDDYGPPPPRRSGGPGDGVATALLVLGIISVVICCCYPISLPLGLSAAICGGLGLKSENNKGMAVAGLVLGIIAVCLSGLMILGAFGNAINPNRFN